MSDYRGLILPDAPQHERKASGFILMDDGNGVIETACTLRCVHGGEHFISIKGSGTRRGFCTKCMGVTCGSPAHDEHYDWRQKIDDYEKGKLGVLR
jgi:hypothetical protein